ncbi:MAG: hypothetical protein P1U40_03645 [Coxiellaceae bacterium]|nr:hypothetical protein [Coxiellaceae bacterium]
MRIEQRKEFNNTAIERCILEAFKYDLLHSLPQDFDASSQTTKNALIEQHRITKGLARMMAALPGSYSSTYLRIHYSYFLAKLSTLNIAHKKLRDFLAVVFLHNPEEATTSDIADFKYQFADTYPQLAILRFFTLPEKLTNCLVQYAQLLFSKIYDRPTQPIKYQWDTLQTLLTEDFIWKNIDCYNAYVTLHTLCFPCLETITEIENSDEEQTRQRSSTVSEPAIEPTPPARTASPPPLKDYQPQLFTVKNTEKKTTQRAATAVVKARFDCHSY